MENVGGVPAGDFCARARLALGHVKARRRFHFVDEGPGESVMLRKRGCWVQILLQDGDVLCLLIDPRTGAVYELMPYLHLVLGDGAARYLPAYCGGSDAVGDGLTLVAGALMDRALDAPMGGDFSWSRDYWRMVDEAMSVGLELAGLMRRVLAGTGEVRVLLATGDLRWIAVGRELGGRNL